MGGLTAAQREHAERAWIDVPLEFPSEQFADPEVWIDSVIGHVEENPELHAELEAVAREALGATAPLPYPAARYWYVGSTDAAQCLAHVYVAENPEAETDARAFALAGRPDAELVHQAYLQEPRYDSAFEATLLVPSTAYTPQLYVLRCIGLTPAGVVLVEVQTGLPHVAGAVAADLALLFQALSAQ